MANSKQLGTTGLIWLQELYSEFEDNPDKLSTFEQDFMESFYKRAIEYQDCTYVSEKQEQILNNIANKLGIPHDFD